MPIGIEDFIRAQKVRHFTLGQILVIAAAPTLLGILCSFVITRGTKGRQIYQAVLAAMLIILNLFVGALILIVEGSIPGLSEVVPWLLYGLAVVGVAIVDGMFTFWIRSSETDLDE